MSKKIFIKNRKGMRIALLLDIVDEQKGLVFVLHGHNGFKEQLHIQAFTESFMESGYTALRIDTTNSINESEGKSEEGTATSYYEDLEDVISWAEKQDWYQEPFCLVGHSLGGLCVSQFAENYPGRVKALAPISTVISGKLSRELAEKNGSLEKWEKTGWREKVSKTHKGLIKRTPWSYQLDKDKYDLLINADKLTMPVLMMVGSEDKSTIPKHQKILFEKLPGKKELHIIEGGPHTFREKEHLDEIKSILKKWIRGVNEI